MKIESLKIMVPALVVAMMLFAFNSAYAEDGWEVNLLVSDGNARNKLSLGMKPDATDEVDGKYDVAAMLAGDIKAWIDLGNRTLWRDIRALELGKKVAWEIKVESARVGQRIEIKWRQTRLPLNGKVYLKDIKAGTTIDMKAIASYSYKNNGLRQFRVEVEL